jgi:serine O-acetyltransferase
MILEISRSKLQKLVINQIESLFTLSHGKERNILLSCIDMALERSEYCFSYTKNKYYSKDGETYFNPFHSGQNSIFLYFLSNSIFSSYPEAHNLADRVYYLNKTLNGLDLFYQVEMPSIFFLDHPVGSVLGRAKYSERFSFSQNCTVGNNKGIYPTFGQNVKMMAGSKVLGNCRIGSNVIISANSYIKDFDIPSCSLVFGISPNLVIKIKDEEYFKDA